MPKRDDIKKVLIIGSGPIIIGQACEFDYSGTQALKALKALGYYIILVNSNPATIMTDPDMADATYIEPLNINSLREIIKKERPDALLPNLGGQTALNLSFDLAEKGILAEYGVRLIGVNIEAIKRGEDRESFKKTMDSIGIETAKSRVVTSLEEARDALDDMGLPLVVRPAYTMGGTGGGFVYNMEEFEDIVGRGLAASPVRQLLIEESLRGWEELEVEIVRDSEADKIAVCFIENIDAMGVHTGDSFCTAPMLDVADELKERLKDYAFRIVDAIEVIGGTNVQFAYNPESDRLIVIEINPRTSRSSALASKATGFPIAFVSAMLALGFKLREIPYWKRGSLDLYTPPEDYVVVKFARWAFEKFTGVYDKLGTQMRAVGEVMSIGKTFKEAMQKAVRSLEISRYGFGFARDFNKMSLDALLQLLLEPSSETYFILYEALRKGADIESLHKITHIKPFFLKEIQELVFFEEEIIKHKGELLPPELLIEAKKNGFADKYLAMLLALPEEEIREQRRKIGLKPGWGLIPVSGVEDASYYYSSYHIEDKLSVSSAKKVMVLGSGPNRIGQGIEFDYCCVHTSFALREAGYETIMVNCNPETVSTDYDTSDRLYFEPLSVEDVLAIYEKEGCSGLVVQFGGQTPLNIARELEEAGVPILGTKPSVIDMAEDRALFNAIIRKLDIPQPESGMANTKKEAELIAESISYPLMLRPSYVLGGRAMEVVYDKEALNQYLERVWEFSFQGPILIDKFLSNAIELEADALCDGEDAFVPAIMEHIEMAGVHSGDSACIIPPVSISEKHLKTIEEYTKKIAFNMGVKGLINIQYAIYNDRVYILEANPRASRTVPLVSKICAIPMAKLALRLMLGEKIRDMDLKRPLYSHFGVKEAVFPFSMFPEVDPILGPEMRSTGEVLGLAHSPGLAFFKAEEAANASLPLEGRVLITIADQDKQDILEAARLFASMNFSIVASSGTGDFLRENGVFAESILKLHEGRPHIVDAIKNNQIQLIINTPSGRQSQYDDSYIRKAAIRYKLPYITTSAGALAAAKGIEARRKGFEAVQSLQELHGDMSF